MTLEEIRKEIDQIDPEIKKLFLRRMEVAKKVAETKFVSGDEIYKRDREAEIIGRLTEDVVPELKMEYTSVIKKIMEVARKYEYGLILGWNGDAANNIFEKKADCGEKECKLQILVSNDGYGIGMVVSVINNYGFRIREIHAAQRKDELLEIHCTVVADTKDKEMKTLIYQLSQESIELTVL